MGREGARQKERESPGRICLSEISIGSTTGLGSLAVFCWTKIKFLASF